MPSASRCIGTDGGQPDSGTRVTPDPSTLHLILGGGGARDFAHLGVLRALEHSGFRPEAVVGVSMGAVVGVTYAMRDGWYEAVLAMAARPCLLRRTGVIGLSEDAPEDAT